MADIGCGVAHKGCGVAHTGCGVAHTGCGVAHIGYGVAHTVARRLAVRPAPVHISARHPRGGPLPSGSHEDNKRVFDE